MKKDKETKDDKKSKGDKKEDAGKKKGKPGKNPFSNLLKK